ncbi:MAG TPA: AmmeMemoRadiSam system protein A [Candidatus Nanoarchaeia archaeon]|nr:AmmeMemoRadiSam system protein A [Candidatus Nanoarchaeia archaeon]
MALKLTELARKTIEAYFNDEGFVVDNATKLKFKDKKASFVTLTKNKKLRGCIGSLESRKELWKDVQENVINSAFHDPRFMPLKKEELKAIKIEISVLTKPKKIEAKDAESLLDKIDKNMGLILKKGYQSSTFLPQVWEEIPDKEGFLEELSLKAGLDEDGWKNSEIWYYRVEVERE